MELLYVSIGINAIIAILVIALLLKSKNKKDKNVYVLEHLEKSFRDEIAYLRNEQANNIAKLEESITNRLLQISQTQNGQLINITKMNNDVIGKMCEGILTRLEEVRFTVDSNLKEIRKDTDIQLEKMRYTVDEKLHKTLEERLGQSFRLVSERLEEVQKGLGEMKNLAVGVGDLKKVLSNVKTRGIMGELQLGSILEQILSQEQYEKNVAVNPNTNDVVEFAIKLPGKDEVTYMPIDAKFPMESYYRLNKAYEDADIQNIEIQGKALENVIKKCAADISRKYIYPPATTDFAIMFLAVEGLYAEVVRRPDLLNILQRDYKVIVAGPTTFAALLNSLLMGFNTLSIEKRSRDVFNILTQVRTEFNKFYTVLEKAQKKINDAGNEIEMLVGVRTKRIVNSLNKVNSIEYNQDEIDE